VQRLVEAHPDLPVYWVDVIGGRPLSRALADRLGIVHESPQAILLRGGTPVWHASHFAVTAEAMARELRERGE
jgi:bacillithiol system protein YtxJ